MSLVIHHGHAQTIDWLTDDKKTIKNYEDNQHYSISHDTLALLLKSLNQNDFRLRPASVARIATQLIYTDNTCVAGRMKTPERVGTQLFSRAFNLHPMPKLYLNSDQVVIPESALDNQGRIQSLVRILEENPGKSLTRLASLSFGQEVDNMVNQLSESQVSYFSVDNRYQTKAQLLMNGYVDLIIGYPIDFANNGIELKRQTKITGHAFATQSPFSISYVACSDSPKGKAMIGEVNVALRQLVKTDAYLQAHLRYLPEEDKPKLIAFYNTVFNTDFK